MTQATETPARPAVGRIAFPEFVVLIASMMALTALSLDMMLPALPAIGAAFQLADPNDAQLVIVVYLFGFAAGHLYAGPLSDRLGRKPILMTGLVVYAVGSLMAAAAPDFTTLLIGRVIQGLGAAAPRVVAMAVVRDRYAGRGMSRVMSFIMMVFIMVPVIAPTLGSGMLLLGPWRWIFGFLVLAGAALAFWSALRLEETCPPGEPVPLLTAVKTMLTTPQSLGYTLAIGFMFGNLMTYVATAEQVFTRIYGLGQGFTLLFGAIAFAVVAASFSNSRIVERVGMRRVSHTALVAYLVLCAGMAVFGFPAEPPLSGVRAVLCGDLLLLRPRGAEFQRPCDGAAGPRRRRGLVAGRLLDDGGRRQLRRPGRRAVRRHRPAGYDRLHRARGVHARDRPGDRARPAVPRRRGRLSPSRPLV
ncbi:MAG: multidrug effflux MFS transporter [Rhodovibrio sp.]|nr:multidrug effflux MFS transporter [Rhodovibrio sp.]